MPEDSEKLIFPRRVKSCLYTRTPPTPVKSPKMIVWSEASGQLLNLDKPQADNIETQVFSGNHILDGMTPISTRYGGHQFGHWADQLGDGRAITLGEVINQDNQRWEIQLKGAGITPYSRSGDGRAVLRSSLREFLCSEAMHFLKIPTTRSLCMLTTGESILRDMFYDGNPRLEPGAITTRLAPSFLRFGHFQMLTYDYEYQLLNKLVDYTIKYHYPQFYPPSEENYLLWFEDVCRRTAYLIVEWMRVGFVHGVMNTDNMSILGLTIDYGPFGWIDDYDPSFTPNTTDFKQRRYRFEQQPAVAHWNLAQLAKALSPLFNKPHLLQRGLDLYESTFSSQYLKMMSNKLGITSLHGPYDTTLLQKLDQALRSLPIDMTCFYRQLADLHLSSNNKVITPIDFIKNFSQSLYHNSPDESSVHQITSWINQYLERSQQDQLPQQKIYTQMNKVNPAFILRNYLTYQANYDLERHGNDRLLQSLLKAIETPYEVNKYTQEFIIKRPSWAVDKTGCSVLSCSS